MNLAQGWCPFNVSFAQASGWLSMVEPPHWFRGRAAPEQPIDPLNEPNLVAEVLAEAELSGTTIFSARFVHRSVAHYLEQLEALVSVHAATMTPQ